MSLRLRLSLLFSAMLAVALVITGATMHVVVEQSARAELQQQLAEEAQMLVASNIDQQTDVRPNARPTPAPENIDPIEGGPEVDPSAPVMANAVASDAAPAAKVVTFSDLCNNVIGQLRQMMSTGKALPMSDAGISAVKSGQPWAEISAIENEPLLVYSQPIVKNDHVVGVAQVARPFDDHAPTLATANTALLIGGGTATVLVFGLTWLLAGFALRPLTKFGCAAQSIATANDFGARLDAPSTHRRNEIGQLATALNGMLDQLHMAYRQSNSQLEAQRDFVADVSHELRTPLTTVRGNLSLLQRAPLDDAERKEVLRDAVDEVERMSRLVNELLLMSRTGAQPALALQSLNIAPLAQAMCRKASAVARGRELRCDLAAQAWVNGNADAINQVLLILLDNAIKFTPFNGRITLSLKTDATYAYLIVSDSGVGIAPDALPHIFDRFYRGAGLAERRNHNGHGLGLAIAKSLVDGQGGSIGVESVVGQGTTFTVALPLVG